MTDPKCHKVNCTYVTEVEHGESSFASGNSCFDSDDESTSSEDDEDDSDDYLSHLHNKNNTIGTWATKNGYNLTTFDQLECRGKWSNDLPLPLPMWAKKSKPALVIDTIYAYEDIVALIETTLQHMIQETHYDTVNNFVDFYQAYKNSRTKNLGEFFKGYSPKINRQNHMCVSLAMEIVSRVAILRPDIANHFFLVSCEESVEDTILYIEHCEQTNIESAAWNLEKEHALVAMKINVAGREGMLVLDPGYHVARVVTVMKDQNYPHTGIFVQSEEIGCKREYWYTFSHSSDQFISWNERTTRNGQQKYEVSLIYVGRHYRSAVDVTVRRNLVYEFRSLLSRNAKGRVLAGIYFPVLANTADANCTIFYDDEGINNKIFKLKVKFSAFKDINNIPDNLMCHLTILASQLRMDLTTLINTLKISADIVADSDFVAQMLSINDGIAELSADN